MKLSKIIFSMLTVLGAAAAFNVFAQATPAAPNVSVGPMKAHAGHGFAAMDKNGDGVISRDEAAARPRMAKMFDTLDADKDGALSKDEMKAAHDKIKARHMERNDTDRDGRISRAEAAASAWAISILGSPCQRTGAGSGDPCAGSGWGIVGTDL